MPQILDISRFEKKNHSLTELKFLSVPTKRLTLPPVAEIAFA